MSLQKRLFGDVVVAVIKCVSQTVLRLSWYDIMSFENAPLFSTDNKTIDFLFYKSVQFQFDCLPKLLSSDASVSVSSFQSIQGQKAQKVCALVNKKTLTGSKKFTQWCEVPLPLKPNKGKCLFSDSRLLKVFFFCTISVRVNINGVTSPIEQSRHAPLPAPFLWIVKSGNGTQWLVHIVGKWYWVKQFTAWNTPYTGHWILSSWKRKEQC